MSVDAVQSRMTEIRGLIDTMSGAPSTARATAAGSTSSTTGTSSTSSTSSTSFAAALSAAGGTTATAATSTTAGLTGAGASITGASLVQAATKYIGVPYVWGGESSSGMDCSGLVQRSMADLGVSVPRLASQQMTLGTPVASLDQALPGDLLVFRGGAHIGIYAGDGKMVVAPKPGDAVKLEKVYETPTAIRRVLPEAAAAPAAADVALAARLVSVASQRAALTMLSGTSSTDSTSSLDDAMNALTSAATGTTAAATSTSSVESIASSQYSALMTTLGVSA